MPKECRFLRMWEKLGGVYSLFLRDLKALFRKEIQLVESYLAFPPVGPSHGLGKRGRTCRRTAVVRGTLVVCLLREQAAERLRAATPQFPGCPRGNRGSFPERSAPGVPVGIYSDGRRANGRTRTAGVQDGPRTHAYASPRSRCTASGR